MADTTLTADHILAETPDGPRWLRGGHVAWEGSTIVSVGPGPGPSGERLELGESVVVPGLIDLDALADIDHLILDNAHAPAHQASFAGSSDYWRGAPRGALDAQQRATMREFAVTQLALHGVTTFMPIAAEVHTCWAETDEELRGVAEHVRRVGIRGYLGPSYRSAVVAQGADGERELVVDEKRGEASFAEALAFAEWAAQSQDDLVHAALLPCRVETLSESLMRRTAQEAARLQVPVRMHCLQQLWERQLVLERSGMTPLELLGETGLLGQHLLVPHGIYLDRHPAVHGEDRGDLARLVEAGVCVIHCPLTSFRYGSMLDSIADYQDAGLTVALGSDSFPPDLVRGMDVGLHSHRLQHGHSRVGLDRYLRAAGPGGADALRRPSLGRLEVGATADLSAFSLSDIRTGVRADPWRTLVYNGSARDVIHTVVAGRTVVEDGTLPGVDLEELRVRAQEVFDIMRAAYTDRDREHRPQEVLFPPTAPAW
ncbi:MAG: chlorohydrolase family protein [Ornithinimicrobium sp.]|uniref:chlorohydrolase family protein n=1 Tax=Ornithinimicrobium sp. TaxID=1977084 RepID=UPI0026E07D85|nr:chlorohydrolase family protein [Ornithinimicrobium sp.]MDO5740604.1 chlorohydrolase family protein [Ornithinimicrobium sp.]